MKKSILFICGLALLAAGCAKEQTIDIQQEETPRQLTVNVTVNHDGPDTRAVKTGWEDGDKVYVVFDNFFTDGTKVYYLTLTREGDSWKSEFSDQALVDYLLDKKSGKLAAAYCSGGALDLKYKSASVIEVSNWAELPGFVLSTSQAVQYNVTDANELKATITMTLTSPSVQFFIEGVEKDKAGNYSLIDDHLCKYSVKNFQLVSSSPKAGIEYGSLGEIITGAYYKEGVQFCCRLSLASVGKETEYVITIIDNCGTPDDDSDDITYTLTKTATLNNRDAVKLPPLTSSRWTKSIAGHDFVELGEGLKWATMNVGADTPEAYGDYFAWGEAKTKTVYSTETYDEEKEFEDAAKENWKGTWRMPTESEMSSLIGNKSLSWKWDDTKKGYTITSSISGYEGNSIFLPAASMYNQDGFVNLWDGKAGCYWTSTLNSANTQYAWYLYFFEGNLPEVRNSDRFYGRSVRAVAD